MAKKRLQVWGSLSERILLESEVYDDYVVQFVNRSLVECIVEMHKLPKVKDESLKPIVSRCQDYCVSH